MTAIPRELLWKAWPDGCIEARGVSTVGGYLHWGNGYWITDPGVLGEPGHSQAEMWGVVDPKSCAPLRAGHLLPKVDPADAATWACLLRDLAGAVNARVSRDERFERFTLDTSFGLTFTPTGSTYWRLTDGFGNCWSWACVPGATATTWERMVPFPPYAADSELALVYLRIYERELAARRAST